MNTVIKELNHIKKAFFEALIKSNTRESLENIRVSFLGRKGQIAVLMSKLKELPLEEKKIVGPLMNAMKTECDEAFEKKSQELELTTISDHQAQKEYFDVTAYRPHTDPASLHPLTLIQEHVNNVFISMGFDIADGPEVETDYYNFEALNIPKDHPAREMVDTFWLDIPGLLLRTHTSAIQIHSMENKKPPLALAAPGRAYRHEATDASHDFLFMQTEGLVVDKNISMGNLLATAREFFSAVFETRTFKLRVRPSYFPFVEPGIEIDIECPFCNHGCSVCKKSEWIEMGGAGLVHPNVLESCGIDAKKYSGFAWGLGLTRLAMLKYGINDVRLLHSGTIEFLKQF
jgi:phenylalanyl-tRNA synthetase alpha chain